jgi:hypothetical protein
MRKSAPWLKTTLIRAEPCSAQMAVARKKGSYLQAQFYRLRARPGAKKAVGVVAASILTAAHHRLTNGTFYQDLGADHFERCESQLKPNALSPSCKSLGSESGNQAACRMTRGEFLSRIPARGNYFGILMTNTVTVKIESYIPE